MLQVQLREWGWRGEGNNEYEFRNQNLIVWTKEKGLFTSVSKCLFRTDDFILPFK